MTKVGELREAVSTLSISDRAELVAFLIAGLEDTHHWVEDDEVLRRREELDSGEVKGLTLEGFKQACGR